MYISLSKVGKQHSYLYDGNAAILIYAAHTAAYWQPVAIGGDSLGDVDIAWQEKTQGGHRRQSRLDKNKTRIQE